MEDSKPPKTDSTFSGVRDTDESAVAYPPVVSLQEHMDVKLGSLEIKVDAVRETMLSRADSVETKVDALKENMNQRMGSLEIKVGSLETRGGFA